VTQGSRGRDGAAIQARRATDAAAPNAAL